MVSGEKEEKMVLELFFKILRDFLDVRVENFILFGKCFMFNNMLKLYVLDMILVMVEFNLLLCGIEVRVKA